MDGLKVETYKTKYPLLGKLDWVASIPVRVGLCGPARRNEDLFSFFICPFGGIGRHGISSQFSFYYD